jgi:hypothetical protein
MAIAQIESYLELVPHAKNTDEVRERLATFQKLNASATAPEKINQQ